MKELAAYIYMYFYTFFIYTYTQGIHMYIYTYIRTILMYENIRYMCIQYVLYVESRHNGRDERSCHQVLKLQKLGTAIFTRLC